MDLPTLDGELELSTTTLGKGAPAHVSGATSGGQAPRERVEGMDDTRPVRTKNSHALSRCAAGAFGAVVDGRLRGSPVAVKLLPLGPAADMAKNGTVDAVLQEAALQVVVATLGAGVLQCCSA